MRKIIAGYIESVDDSLYSAAERHRLNKNSKFERREICQVDENFVDEIKKLYGLDLEGFTLNINSNAFNHIERRHGENGIADKSMSNLDDVARLGYVFRNRDSVEPLKKENGEQVLSAEFRTKDNSRAPLVLIKKKINGSYYCVIAATDSAWKKAWVVSAFINKKSELSEVLNDEISSLSHTPEADHPASSPISNIPQKNEKSTASKEKKQSSYSSPRHRCSPRH